MIKTIIHLVLSVCAITIANSSVFGENERYFARYLVFLHVTTKCIVEKARGASVTNNIIILFEDAIKHKNKGDVHFEGFRENPK